MNSAKVKLNEIFHVVAWLFLCKVTLRMMITSGFFNLSLESIQDAEKLPVCFPYDSTGDICSESSAVLFLSADWLRDLAVQEFNAAFFSTQVLR